MNTPSESTPSDTTQTLPDSEQRKPRAVLSCITCRNRKLRCDRGRPCRNCAKRNQTCRYYSITSAGKDVASSRYGPARVPADLSRRLQHLEDLLVVLNGQQEGQRRSSSAGKRSLPSAPSDSDDSNDHLVDRSGNPPTIPPAQWQAVLDHISELRSFLLRESAGDGFQSSPARDGPLQTSVALFSVLPLTTKVEILASLPSKSTADALVDQVFKSGEPAVVMVHEPTFRREYLSFWAAPDSTSLAWLAKLFALLCLSGLFQLRQGKSIDRSFGDQTKFVQTLRLRSAQSLIMSNYTRPGPHKVEALIVYMATEYFKSKDTQLGVAMIISLIIRLALSMGYHRDPARDPNISPFECEMIRRRWAFLVPVERMISFNMGLPSMTSNLTSNTKPPLNILDRDIDPISMAAPTERPISERTPMSFIIAKGHIAKAFVAIVDALNTQTSLPCPLISQLDDNLQAACSKIPDFLKYRAISHSHIDPTDLIMNRIYVDLLALKARCMLHRQSLTNDPTNARYSQSRIHCVEASRQILRLQADIHREIQPSGRLHSHSCFMLGLATSDFLLAAMIIALSISQAEMVKGTHDLTTLGFPDSEAMRARLLQELGTSQMIWTSLARRSSEAGRASEAIALILSQALNAVKGGQAGSMLPAGSVSVGNGSADSVFPRHMRVLDRVSPPSAFVETPRDTISNSNSSTNTNILLNSLPDPGDWETWDRYFSVAEPMQSIAEAPDVRFYDPMAGDKSSLAAFADLGLTLDPPLSDTDTGAGLGIQSLTQDQLFGLSTSGQ